MELARGNLGENATGSWFFGTELGLFNGTIMENLRYGNENATEGELIAFANPICTLIDPPYV